MIRTLQTVLKDTSRVHRTCRQETLHQKATHPRKLCAPLTTASPLQGDTFSRTGRKRQPQAPFLGSETEQEKDAERCQYRGGQKMHRGRGGVKEGQVGRRDSWVQPVQSDRFFSPIKGVCSGSSLHPQSGNYRFAAAGFRETDEAVLLINQPSLDLSGKVPHTSGDLEVAVQFLVHLPAGGLTLASWQTYSKPQFLTQE